MLTLLLVVGVLALVMNLVGRRWIRRRTWVAGAASFLAAAAAIGYQAYRDGRRSGDGLGGDVSHDRHTAETLTPITAVLLVSLAVWAVSVWFDWRNERLDRL